MSTTTTFDSMGNVDEYKQSAEGLVRRYGGGLVFRRWVATWIDFIILGGVFFFSLGMSKLLGDELFGKTSFIWGTLGLALFASYYFLQEALTGYTIGKFIMRIRVVDSKCSPPGFGKAIIRTLFRLIEVNPILFGGAPAGIAVISSGKGQRIGDMVAKTYVVKSRDIYSGNASLNKRHLSLIIGLITIVAAVVGVTGFSGFSGKIFTASASSRYFISPDGNARITCPSNWAKMDVERLFEGQPEVKIYAVGNNGSGAVKVIQGPIEGLNEKINPKDFMKILNKYNHAEFIFISATKPVVYQSEGNTIIQFEMETRYGQIDYRMFITSIKSPGETYTLICDIDKAKGNMATLYEIAESFATRENK